MMHANTDIATIMGQKTDFNRSKVRAASGQRRQIPKPALDYSKGGTNFAASLGKRGAFDAEGAKIRKELAMLNNRKSKPIDVKEDA